MTGFDWQDYFRLAIMLKGLGHSSTCEFQSAALRACVSRAYYAAYCFTRNEEKNSGEFIPDRSGDDHSRLRIHLREKGKYDAAECLEDLHKWRKQCDYDDTLVNLDNIAQDSIDTAGEIFS